MNERSTPGSPTLLEIPMSAALGTRSLVVDNRTAFKHDVLAIIERGVINPTIDLRNVDYIDSTGLGVLCAIAKTALQRGGRLTVIEPNPDLSFLFENMRLDTIFRICTMEQWIRGDGAPISTPIADVPCASIPVIDERSFAAGPEAA